MQYSARCVWKVSKKKVKALLHCREDCTVEVSKWVTEVFEQCFQRFDT